MTMEGDMKINKRNPSSVISRMMFGFLFIGGIATILGVFHAVKNAEVLHGNVVLENDEDVFVYGSHA
jgi:hypothetical protein